MGKNLHELLKNKALLLMLLLTVNVGYTNAQNLALTATASHSGGGATTYSAANYNDGVIAGCGSTPWGWVSTNGWIEYVWSSPQTITKVRFFKDNRPMTTCTIEYWTGSTYATITNYSNSVTCLDSISFSAVTTTRLRFNNVAGNSNPNHREIEVYGITCSTQVNQQPADKTVCENQQATFSITAQDVTSYKWQVDEGTGFFDLANGINYSGVTTATLTVNNTPFGFDGNMYRCLVAKNTSSACADTSDEVLLTVHGLVKLDDLKPRDTTCINAVKNIEVKAQGSITSYKWQMLLPGQGYVDIPQQPPFQLTGNKIIINGVPDTLDGTRFRCMVVGMCDSVVSKELLLTVSLVPKVAVPPADVLAKQGDNVTFEVQASAAGARYQWQVAAPDTFVNINDGGIYQGAKSNKLTVWGVSRVQDGFKFRCEVKSGPQCNAPGDTSSFAVLSVTPPASVGSIAGEELMVLYPNPTNGDLYIKTNINTTNDLKYKVIDKTGRTVIVGAVSNNNTKIQVGKLASDIYLVQIIDADNNTIATSRFTKL